ncbi:MAG: DegT/DnrJ/EryC1/StrS family aminotransferase, partial [Candidatus Omnitrophica bacterium]|nr:DegT/DnrJ/EryC1/StrS family aminotransferase [Candidatus Omnitrophota bacterium]
MTIPPLNLQAEFREIRSALIPRMRRIFTSGRYILGSEVSQLEKDFARFVGTRYAVGVASGSDALLLALMAFDVKPGDEIITTPFSFIATATAIVRLGAKPVFVDVEPDTFNLNPDLIRKKVTGRTRGIVPVHLYGNPCGMDEILKIAKRFKLFVVEDCAQACGATFRGKQVGTFGDFGAFSFYPTKTIGAMGDAGALTTNNKKLYEKIKSLHLHGQMDHSYHHPLIGINSRLDEIQAAVLNVKLKHLAKWNKKRRDAAERYHRLLVKDGLSSPQRRGPTKKGTGNTSCLSPFLSVPVETPYGKSVFHQYVIRTAKRDALFKFLKDRGVSAAVYYP